jgi:hypothetical protein
MVFSLKNIMCQKEYVQNKRHAKEHEKRKHAKEHDTKRKK